MLHLSPRILHLPPSVLLLPPRTLTHLEIGGQWHANLFGGRGMHLRVNNRASRRMSALACPCRLEKASTTRILRNLEEPYERGSWRRCLQLSVGAISGVLRPPRGRRRISRVPG